MSEKIVHITDADFQSTLEGAGDKPVFVDRAVICKYNVDENSTVASANGIRGIPTILVYKAGQLVDQHVGAMGRSELNAFIEKFL